MAGLADGPHAPVPAVPAVGHRPRPDQARPLGPRWRDYQSGLYTYTGRPKREVVRGFRLPFHALATRDERGGVAVAVFGQVRPRAGTQTVEVQRRGPDGRWRTVSSRPRAARTPARAGRSRPTGRASTRAWCPTRGRGPTARAGTSPARGRRSARPRRSVRPCPCRAARTRRCAAADQRSSPSSSPSSSSSLFGPGVADEPVPNGPGASECCSVSQRRRGVLLGLLGLLLLALVVLGGVGLVAFGVLGAFFSLFDHGAAATRRTTCGTPGTPARPYRPPARTPAGHASGPARARCAWPPRPWRRCPA